MERIKMQLLGKSCLVHGLPNLLFFFLSSAGEQVCVLLAALCCLACLPRVDGISATATSFAARKHCAKGLASRVQ
jgi:hypothetical protein